MSCRECDFCHMLGHGTRLCPARDLYNFWITCHRVKNHVHSLYPKLGQRSHWPQIVQVFSEVKNLVHLHCIKAFALRVCQSDPHRILPFCLMDVVIFVFQHEVGDLRREQLLPLLEQDDPFHSFSFEECGALIDMEMEMRNTFPELMRVDFMERVRNEMRLLPLDELPPRPRPRLECPVCLESLGIESFVVLDDCHHKVCHGCFARSVKSVDCFPGCALCRKNIGVTRVPWETYVQLQHNLRRF